MHFQWLFKNIVFRSVALVRKKVIGYFRFFSQTGLFFHCTKFHGDGVKNKSARTKNYERGAKQPPHRLFRVHKAKSLFFKF